MRCHMIFLLLLVSLVLSGDVAADTEAIRNTLNFNYNPWVNKFPPNFPQSFLQELRPLDGESGFSRKIDDPTGPRIKHKSISGLHEVDPYLQQQPEKEEVDESTTASTADCDNGILDKNESEPPNDISSRQEPLHETVPLNERSTRPLSDFKYVGVLHEQQQPGYTSGFAQQQQQQHLALSPVTPPPKLGPFDLHYNPRSPYIPLTEPVSVQQQTGSEVVAFGQPQWYPPYVGSTTTTAIPTTTEKKRKNPAVVVSSLPLLKDPVYRDPGYSGRVGPYAPVPYRLEQQLPVFKYDPYSTTTAKPELHTPVKHSYGIITAKPELLHTTVKLESAFSTADTKKPFTVPPHLKFDPYKNIGAVSKPHEEDPYILEEPVLDKNPPESQSVFVPEAENEVDVVVGSKLKTKPVYDDSGFWVPSRNPFERRHEKISFASEDDGNLLLLLQEQEEERKKTKKKRKRKEKKLIIVNRH